MKKLLHEVKDLTGETYQLYAELVDSVLVPGVNFKQLSFYGIWLGNTNPKSQPSSTTFLLSEEALDNLKQLLESK
jgi:hypothetical protein